MKRIRNNDVDPGGVVNHNPLIGKIKYEVQYLDGFMVEMTANRIVDTMLLQVDSEGYHLLLLK